MRPVRIARTGCKASIEARVRDRLRDVVVDALQFVEAVGVHLSSQLAFGGFKAVQVSDREAHAGQLIFFEDRSRRRYGIEVRFNRLALATAKGVPLGVMATQVDTRRRYPLERNENSIPHRSKLEVYIVGVAPDAVIANAGSTAPFSFCITPETGRAKIAIVG